MGFFDFLKKASPVLPLVGVIPGLFDSNDKSRTEDIQYPKYFDDPNFTSTQDFLNTYSKDLLTQGPNDYYAPIGEYGSPEFLNYLNVANNDILGGTAEALARTGRGRGGRLGEVTAQAIGDSNRDLKFRDYLRAMQGREMFFNTGLNTQANVRNAAFANQGNRNTFNQEGAQFDFNKALYGDQYDRQSSQDIGRTIGTIGGGIAGFFAGGPMGAITGASLGGSALGGGDAGSAAQFLDLLEQTKKRPSGTQTNQAEVSGVSPVLGRAQLKGTSTDELMAILSSMRN